MNTIDEGKLLQYAQEGDLDAFNRLVIAYQTMAYNVAYRILGDEPAAEDATQLAFISAYRHLTSYRGGSFRAWLMRIVTNSCYDELRRIKRRPTTALEPLTEDGEDEIESPTWLADGAPSPEEQMENAELEHAIQDCLNRLPDDFRTVLVLVDVQGLDYTEVSDSTGNPLGTIKSRLARARMKLRDCLQRFKELLPVAMRH